MERLSHRQLQRLRSLISDIYEMRNLSALRRDVIALLPALVACDTCSYNDIDLPRRRIEWIAYPAEVRFPDSRRILSQHIHEHPLVRYYVRNPGVARVLKISDVLSQWQFRRLGIYQDYYRRIGVEHQMAVTIALTASHGLAGVHLAFNRSGPDFGERERLSLKLMRPHLVEAYRSAATVTRLAEALRLAAAGNEEAAGGIVFLGAKGRVKLMTRKARRQLASIYGELALRNNRLPDELTEWIRGIEKLSDRVSIPRRPLLLEGGPQRLWVRLVTNSHERLLFIEGEEDDAQPGALERLGLTRREAEVLAWVCQGKTNLEIATILGLSVRTVEKHLEHILQKLGVETRTAACAVARRLAAVGVADCTPPVGQAGCRA